MHNVCAVLLISFNWWLCAEECESHHSQFFRLPRTAGSSSHQADSTPRTKADIRVDCLASSRTAAMHETSVNHKPAGLLPDGGG